MRRKLLLALCLVAALAAAFAVFHKVFSFKYDDGITHMEGLYRLEEDTVDVLVLGSSHAFENINPAVLWEEAGISAYDLCGSLEPMWNCYYDLVEALKTQSPRLVILEAYCLTNFGPTYKLPEGAEYMNGPRVVKNIFGMAPSRTKWEALQASVPAGERAAFALEYIQYHRRYRELGREDFLPYKGDEAFYANWTGFYANLGQNPFPKPQVEAGSPRPLAEKQERYCRLILELCRERDIEVLLALAPYTAYSAEDAGYMESAKALAAECGASYVNFNERYDAIGFDWDTDFSDHAHMSFLGQDKFSRYLAGYLTERYRLPDHRGDGRYALWDGALRYYRGQKLDRETVWWTADGCARTLSSLPADCTAVITVQGPLSDTPENAALRRVLVGWGIPVDRAAPESVWVVDAEGAVQYGPNGLGYLWSRPWAGGELLADGEGVYRDGQRLTCTDSGVNILLLDEVTGRVADSVGVEGSALVR